MAPTQIATLIAQHTQTVTTRGRSMIEISAEVERMVAESALQTGMAHIFTHHTSCSLLITENADPTVRADLERYFARLVPDGDAIFRHTAEGDDDMSAHVRSVLTQTTVSVPITKGRLALGTWQGVYLWEHREDSHRRTLTVTLIGC